MLIRCVESAISRTTPKADDGRPDLRNTEFFERYAQRLQDKLDRKLGQLAETNQALIDYVTRGEAILNVSPLAIVSIDTHHRIRSWNLAAECQFGYTESEAVGRSLEVVIPADRMDEAVGRSEAARTEGTVRLETQWRHRDDHLVEVAMSVSYLDGEMPGGAG